MKTIEHKHVRHTFGLREALSKKRYHEALMKMLNEQGKEGWELKATIYELGFHVHFIFARESDDGQRQEA